DARYRDLDANHRALRERHASLESKMARRTQSFQQFSDKAAKRLARKKAVELSQLLERAVPYIGIPVTLGVTAYGLNSDCQLMKESNALAQEEGRAEVATAEVSGFRLPSSDEIRDYVRKHSDGTLQRIDGLAERICDQFVQCGP